MGKLYDELNDQLLEFIAVQKMFFVGSAPLAGEGHVNISPKGKDCFRVVDNHTVAYLDMTGSGAETIAHVKENQRLVFMFCAFEGRPLTLRLHGKGDVVERSHEDFAQLIALFPELPAVRSIIRMRITRIADSCGWVVPEYEFKGMRDYYDKYAANKSDADMRASQLKSNMLSIDGLAALSEPSF